MMTRFLVVLSSKQAGRAALTIASALALFFAPERAWGQIVIDPGTQLYLEVSSTAANLSWSTLGVMEGSYDYRVEWGTEEDIYEYSMEVGSATEAHIYPLSRGLSYHFRVVPHSAEGDLLGPSNVVSAELSLWKDETQVCGVVSENTEWSPANNPYVLTCTVSVGASGTATLTIDPGTEVQFRPSDTKGHAVHLEVGWIDEGIPVVYGAYDHLGALQAVGTPSSPILFLSTETENEPGSWGGIRFGPQTLPDSILKYVAIENGGRDAGANVEIHGSSPTILNSRIGRAQNPDCLPTELNLSPSCPTTRGSAVLIESSGSVTSPVLEGNTFYGNADYDVKVFGPSGAVLRSNTFAKAAWIDEHAEVTTEENLFLNYSSTGAGCWDQDSPSSCALRLGPSSLALSHDNLYRGTDIYSMVHVVPVDCTEDGMSVSPEECSWGAPLTQDFAGILPAEFTVDGAYFEWDELTPRAGDIGYKVLWGTEPDAYDHVLNAGSALSANVSGLQPSGFYFFTVNANDGDGIWPRGPRRSGSPNPFCFDYDNDGVQRCIPGGGDCNDNNNQVYPGHPELCNAIDDNCNGIVDEASAGCHDTVCDGQDNNGDGVFDDGCAPECTVADANCPFVRDVFGITVSGNQTIFARPEGFGQHATGGYGGHVYYVTTLDDDATSPLPGSLRYGASGQYLVDAFGLDRTAPLWIRFRVRGVLHVQDTLFVESNKTIDGRGTKVQLVDHGLEIKSANSGTACYAPGQGTPECKHNIILENFIVRDCFCNQNQSGDCEGNDAIQLRNHVNTVWIDHVTLRHSGDGLLDFSDHSTDVTISHCDFEDHEQVSLIGIEGWDEDSEARYTRITFHHNYFYRTGKRQPVLEGWRSKAHVYNNVYRNWYLWATASNNWGELLLQHNYFFQGLEPEADSPARYGINDNDEGYGKVNGNLSYGYARNAMPNQEGHVFAPSDCSNTELQGNCYSPNVETAVCGGCDSSCSVPCGPTWCCKADEIIATAGWRDCAWNASAPAGSDHWSCSYP